MEGARQAPPGRSTWLGRPADISVLHGDLLHHREPHRTTGPRAGASRALGATGRARTDHPADAGLVGLVRVFLGRLLRRLLRWRRLLRRRWRLGQLVTPCSRTPTTNASSRPYARPKRRPQGKSTASSRAPAASTI